MTILNTSIWIITIVLLTSFLQGNEANTQSTTSPNTENKTEDVYDWPEETDNHLKKSEATMEAMIECIFQHKEEEEELVNMLLLLKPLLDVILEYHSFRQKFGDPVISSMITKIEKELDQSDKEEKSNEDSFGDDSETKFNSEKLNKRHSGVEPEVTLKENLNSPEYQTTFDERLEDKSLHIRDTDKTNLIIHIPELNHTLSDENKSKTHVNESGKEKLTNNTLFHLISLLGEINVISPCHLTTKNDFCGKNKKLRNEIKENSKDTEIPVTPNMELLCRNELKLRLNCSYSNTNSSYKSFTTQRKGRQSPKNKELPLDNDEYSTDQTETNDNVTNSEMSKGKDYPIVNEVEKSFLENNTEKDNLIPNKNATLTEETSDITSDETSFPKLDSNRTDESFDIISEAIKNNELQPKNAEISLCPNNTDQCDKPVSEIVETPISKENEKIWYTEFKMEIPQAEDKDETNLIKPQNEQTNEVILDEIGNKLEYDTEKKYSKHPSYPEKCFICAEPVDITAENEVKDKHYPNDEDYSTNISCEPHYLPIEMPCEELSEKYRTGSEYFDDQYENKSPPINFHNYQKNKFFEQPNENSWFMPNYRKSTAYRQFNSYDTPFSRYNDNYYSDDEIEYM